MSTLDVERVVCSTAAALIGLEWQPFDRTAVLRFRAHTGESFALRLDGVHLLAARQSLLGRWHYSPLGEEHWEDWSVNYFEISSRGEFLEQFLAGQLGLPSQVVVYSLGRVNVDSARFVRPVHMALVTGGGNLAALARNNARNSRCSCYPGNGPHPGVGGCPCVVEGLAL
jgi:hypothetical protein